MKRHDGNEYLIAADGTIYPLGDYGFRVIGLSEIGASYQTGRGYLQHGHTVHNWRLNTRQLTFQYVGGMAYTPLGYWQRRRALIDALRPNKGIVTYRRVMADGARRDIQGWLVEGPTQEGEEPLALSWGFSLECPDPSFYDPTRHATTLVASEVEALVFPFAFPDDFWFGSATTVAGVVTNGGSWRSYPTIEVTGPYQTLVLHNLTTGASLTLSDTVAAGTAVTLDLTPGAQSIIDNSGGNRLDSLASGSLLGWYLEAGGNALEASGVGLISGTTQIRILHYDRYIAL